MYSCFLSDYIVNVNDTILEAYWKYGHHRKILIAVDNDDKFVGVITCREIDDKYRTYNPNDIVANIVNKKCKTVQYNDNQELMYGNIRNIFADNLNIHYLPILKDDDVVDLFSRQRAFWLQNLQQQTLPYDFYASGLKSAVITAKRVGLNRISAIEFGVAGGNGLKMLEIHAMELSRIYNIEIEVYGFDTGKGLPDIAPDYRNIVHQWQNGCFSMDVDKLKSQLRKAKLILGDVEDTLNDFIEKFNPAPIGFVSIDVDIYTSTVPILNFLGSLKDDYGLPRINMYFDDVDETREFQGECLAIKEFNENHPMRKISPESCVLKIKTLQNFEHKMYNYNDYPVFEIPLRSDFYI